MALTSGPSTGKAEAEGLLSIWGQVGLFTDFQASLDYSLGELGGEDKRKEGDLFPVSHTSSVFSSNTVDHPGYQEWIFPPKLHHKWLNKSRNERKEVKIFAM